MPDSKAAPEQPGSDGARATLLSLRGVGKVFSNGVTALSGVDRATGRVISSAFSAPRLRQVLGLRLIAGLSTRTGAIERPGRRTTTRRFVFQDPTLLPLRACSTMCAAAAMRGVPRERPARGDGDAGARASGKIRSRRAARAFRRKKMRVSIARAMLRSRECF